MRQCFLISQIRSAGIYNVNLLKRKKESLLQTFTQYFNSAYTIKHKKLSRLNVLFRSQKNATDSFFTKQRVIIQIVH